MIKLCFVIMGFGKKTDYETGRTLDLDATYEAIIKPAVEAEGLKCIRADEIIHSGVIDTRMYEMLYRADLVIADITTGNVNAVYELGVRHALRPNATIIMTESRGRLYFDLNHNSTLKYEHLGEDIGVREAKKVTAELQELIKASINDKKPDSPVYTYLPNLKSPLLSEKELNDFVKAAEDMQDDLAQHIQNGELALNESNHLEAIKNFKKAEVIKTNDPYILQKLALATYKSKTPTTLDALLSGLMIIERLNPGESNDPETLGITGAIRRRLWQETNDPAQLDAAINFYGRGFSIRKDYYNGDNYALCLNMRARISEDKEDAMYDKLTAKKARQEIVYSLRDIVNSTDFLERSDVKWIYATLANSLYALGNSEESDKYEKEFYKITTIQWEHSTYEDAKKLIGDLLEL